MSYYWKTMPLEQRIAVRLKPNGECREWTGGLSCKSSQCVAERRPVMKKGYVSRIVWELAHGPIPEAMNVLHHCDNPLCLRTSHLYLGTNDQNVRDRITRGRERHSTGEQHPRAKLTFEQVLEIRSRFALGGIQKKKLAIEYGVSHGAISHILKGRSWNDAAAIPSRVGST